MLNRILKKSYTSRAFIVLVALLLVSLYLASGYLARYVSDDKVDDGSRPASFSFNINEGEEIELDLSDIHKPGDRKTVTFTVESDEKNEVATKYEILVLSSNNLPLTITLSDSSGQLGLISPSTDLGKKAEIKCVGSLAPGDVLSGVYTLDIVWNSSNNSDEFIKMVDAVYISIHGVQIR